MIRAQALNKSRWFLHIIGFFSEEYGESAWGKASLFGQFLVVFGLEPTVLLQEVLKRERNTKILIAHITDDADKILFERIPMVHYKQSWFINITSHCQPVQ